MRYLINLETGATVTVRADDDKKLEQLKAARIGDDPTKPKYEQTGAHDPRVQVIETSGQTPTNAEGKQALERVYGD